jgi:hypothetical protein
VRAHFTKCRDWDQADHEHGFGYLGYSRPEGLVTPRPRLTQCRLSVPASVIVFPAVPYPGY